MGFDGSDLSRINQKLIDCKAEINGINKILDYCGNWADRLEYDIDDNWRRGLDVIGEEFAIINEMVGYCHKRLDELHDELNDIRGQLSRYNHGDYEITCEWYKWFRSPYDGTEPPPVHSGVCKICKCEDCPYRPLD